MSGIMSRFKGLFGPEDEYEEDEMEEIEEQVETVRNIPTQSSINTPLTSPKIVTLGQSGKIDILNFTMQNYNTTGEMFDYIKLKKPIIVNMEELEVFEKQRALDYLSGACEALGGNVEKVTDNIFIFAPEHVNINPEKLKKRSIFPPNM